jgi:hypothetical protein
LAERERGRGIKEEKKKGTQWCGLGEKNIDPKKEKKSVKK